MRIENYRERPANSNEIARFDVYLENVGLTLREFRIVRKKTGGWFWSPPSFSQEKGDKKEWIPYFSLSENRQKEFSDKLFDLLKEFIQ